MKIGGNGKNALDFYLAFYVGDLAAKDPEAGFHILSDDTGFDPLIKHLKAPKKSDSEGKQISSCR